MTEKTILLSDHLNVPREKLESMGIFDSTLGIDTKLFIDPKLLVNSTIPEFKNSRETIVNYFGRLLKIHKRSHITPRLLNEAQKMLAVPERPGLSIGYGNKTDRGTAISKTLANKILLSASEILSVGIEDEEIIELLGLFIEGFGPDSMSDLIISIVYEDFCTFTDRTSKELGIETKEYEIDNKKYNLPIHPFKKSQIIFIPHTLLCPLPIAVSWDDIAAAARYNQNLRDDFNKLIFPALKETLDDIKNKTPTEVEEFRDGFKILLNIYREINVKGYDLKIDPKGYYSLSPFAKKESSFIEVTKKPSSNEELVDSVKELIQQFERSITQNGGNTLLYRKSDTGALLKNEPHNEDVAQILFFLIADFYCQKANIFLSRESNAGLGPVDFALGTGYKEKILVEIKKSNNKDLENGYKKQVVAYEKSEAAFCSFFVVIVVKDSKEKNAEYTSQLERIKSLYEDNVSKKIKTPILIIIDGLVHDSPSKLKSK